MKSFNILETGLKYDYILQDKYHNRRFQNPNQSLYLCALISAHKDAVDQKGSIIVYNSFTRNTFEKWLLEDKDGLYVKIKVQHFEKKVYLHEFV